MTKNIYFIKKLREQTIKAVSLLKNFFEVDFFISNAFVPIAILAFYCGSFVYFSSLFLPEGVNHFFARRLGMYALFATAGAFFVIFKLGKDNKLAFKHSSEKFHPGDLLLLLFPLTPVVQYILNNQDILSLPESLKVLAFVAVVSGFYVFAAPTIFRMVIQTRTLMLLGLAFVFTIASMASLSHYYAWFEEGSLRIQAIFFGGAFLITMLLYNLNQRKILYILVVVNFASNSFTQLLSQNNVATETSLPLEESKLFLLVEERVPVVTPNVYLLVYDSYVPNETMLAYGIDNSLQEDYLRGQGFTLYPHTYSLGSLTTATMSRVLNASTNFYGDPRRAVSGDGITQNIFKDLGYKTYGLFTSDFMFRGYGESYDYSLPERSTPPSAHLLKAIFVGEFRFNIEDDITFDGQTRDQFIKTKQKSLKAASKNQSFVYMHTNIPGHTQTSGACLPNEKDLYKQKLLRANLEMQQDLKTVIANDPGAIIIVAGDHGPHLIGNCMHDLEGYDASKVSRLDIQDRHATFLAIRWPTEDFTQYDEIILTQDLFPSVFAYLYKDVGILQSKIDPTTPIYYMTNGLSVENGIIYGGVDDGEPLFLLDK